MKQINVAQIAPPVNFDCWLSVKLEMQLQQQQ